MSVACLETIETAISRPTSALAQALAHLEDLCGTRGTCLLLEHDGLGETLIADGAWPLTREETLSKRDDHSIVDLRQDGAGFTRLAILVHSIGDESHLTAEGCSLAVAALDVAAALADIAIPFTQRETSAQEGPEEAIASEGPRPAA